MYLVMVRCASDDIPVGLYRELVDAQRAAVMATQFPQECEKIALDVMEVATDWASDPDPDRVSILVFENGVPTGRADLARSGMPDSIKAFTKEAWEEEDDEWS